MLVIITCIENGEYFYLLNTLRNMNEDSTIAPTHRVDYVFSTSPRGRRLFPLPGF